MSSILLNSLMIYLISLHVIHLLGSILALIALQFEMVFWFSSDLKRACIAIPGKCSGAISAWNELANNLSSLIIVTAGT